VKKVNQLLKTQTIYSAQLFTCRDFKHPAVILYGTGTPFSNF